MRKINRTMMAYNNLEAPRTVAISSDSLFLVRDDWWDTPFVNAVTEAGLGSAEDDERPWEFLGRDSADLGTVLNSFAPR